MAAYRGEFNDGHPALPEDSQVKNHEAAMPVDATTPKIEYTSEDDKAIDDYHRKNGTWCQASEEVCLIIELPSVKTSWHSVRVTSCPLPMCY